MELNDLSYLSNIDIKLNIVGTINDLLKTTSFEKIRVTDICRGAHISRATFYRYFEDKYAAAQWYASYYFSVGIREIGRTLTWYEGLYLSESGFSRSREFFAGASQTDGYDSLDSFAYRTTKESLLKTIKDYHEVQPDPQLLFQVDAVASSLVHVLPAWHYGVWDMSLEEYCHWVVELIPPKLFDLLNTPRDPNCGLQKAANLNVDRYFGVYPLK